MRSWSGSPRWPASGGSPDGGRRPRPDASPAARRGRGRLPERRKSTLVNRLAGGREAVTDAEPGVTRDRRALECEWNGLVFDLIDTGGVDLADSDAAGSRRSGAGASGDRGVGGRSCSSSTLAAGLGPGDAELADLLRRSGRPVIVAANKIDRHEDESLAAELNSLGLGEPLPVSASHGLGTGDLLDRLVRGASTARGGGAGGRRGAASADRDPRAAERRQVLAAQRAARLRAGDRQRARGHDPRPRRHRGRGGGQAHRAGRHRRACAAGERSRARSDYYAQLRSERAAERADAAIVVCDATEGVTSEDLRVAELAMRSGCATRARAQQVGCLPHGSRGRPSSRDPEEPPAARPS